MQLFIQNLLVITYVAGTVCQRITFDNTHEITVGRFYIDGTIRENVTELLQKNWQPIVFIQVMRINASRYFTMCQFVVSGARCTPDSVDICQCVYNTTTDNVHFVVNGTADPDLYNAIIRAQWQHQNLTAVYSNKNYTVPGPHGAFCQKITFDNTDAGGITVGRFYIDGTIGGNVTELVQQKWQPIIFIEVKKINASTFSAMCQFDVSGATCTPYPVDICQCVYNTTVDNVRFVVNGAAGPDLYNAIIRAHWQHQNQTAVYSNKNYTVPGPQGAFCQKITFDNTDAGGITVGRFYIDGTIGGNVTELVQQKWQPVIFIEVKKINASTFSAMCQFVVSGARCTPDPVDICQCVYNTTTDNVHFVVNGTADPDLYNAIIRAQWQHQNQTAVYSNKNYTVPGPQGAFCQKITFDNTDAGGITVGRFYIDGTIGGNVTELVQQKWQPFIFIEVKKINASTFSAMCVFGVSGATCDPYPADICQCFYNTTTDNVRFVVNGAAGPDLYKAIIRARWQHQNLTNVYSNKNYTVPGPN